MARLIDQLAECPWLPCPWAPKLQLPTEDIIRQMPRQHVDDLVKALDSELHAKTDGFGEEFAKRLAGTVMVVADNVAAWFFEHFKPNQLELTDCPNAALPFDRIWIETRRGFGADRDPTIVGAFLQSHSVNGMKVVTAKEPIRDQLIRHPDAEWIVEATIVNQDTGRLYAAAWASYAVAKDGRVLGPASFMMRNDQGVILGSDDNFTSADYERWWLALMVTAVSFMHCKNVRRVENVPPAKVNAKRLKRGRQPLVRYYTLQIDGMKSILMGEGKAGTSGIKHALHICRGHFKTYTSERPLLGKHVGTFWVQQHTRGSADRGVVVKDYELATPQPAPTAKEARS